MGFGYNEYKDFIEKFLEEMDQGFGNEAIVSVSLFGSIARGEAYSDSDIDLLVVHKPLPFSVEEKFVDILLMFREGKEYKKLLNKGFYPELSPIFMTSEELSCNPLILLDIMDHGIVLKDRGDFLLEKIKNLKERLKELKAEKIVLGEGSWAWDLRPDWRPGEVVEIFI